MTQVIGAPVTAVARINVVWLDTVRGLSTIIVAWAVIHRLIGGSPSTSWIGLICGCALTGAAWLGLRRFGGPLRFGIAGGVSAVSERRLYIAANNWLTNQPTTLLSSWPRSAIILRRAKRLGLRRLLTVEFSGADTPAHLEILGRRKDDAIAELFGPPHSSC